MADTVHYRLDRGLATITVDRPEAHNSLNTVTKVALRDAVSEAAGDEKVRAVLLTGTGRTFCTGQDLKEHAELLRRGERDPLDATLSEHYEPIARSLVGMPKPVVAAVNGVAAGAGAAFAFACDLRIAGESARFTTAFTQVGLGPDSGLSWTLQRLVGAGRAAELLMLPVALGAAEAERIGLVNRVLPDAELAAGAEAVARELAEGPTRSYAAVKEALALAAVSGFRESLEVEARLQRELGRTEDHRVAVEAFLGKKGRPEFRGR
jgi:2-(1,2-epoxy-1,2-dihydrophenyl)acetyl-CoA isomerase